MNAYEIRVKNAVMTNEALNEYDAMKDLCIFSNIGNMIDGVRPYDESGKKDNYENVAWIYQVELNNQIELAYVKRIA